MTRSVTAIMAMSATGRLIMVVRGRLIKSAGAVSGDPAVGEGFGHGSAQSPPQAGKRRGCGQSRAQDQTGDDDGYRDREAGLHVEGCPGDVTGQMVGDADTEPCAKECAGYLAAMP